MNCHIYVFSYRCYVIPDFIYIYAYDSLLVDLKILVYMYQHKYIQTFCSKAIAHLLMMSLYAPCSSLLVLNLTHDQCIFMSSHIIDVFMFFRHDRCVCVLMFLTCSHMCCGYTHTLWIVWSWLDFWYTHTLWIMCSLSMSSYLRPLLFYDHCLYAWINALMSLLWFQGFLPYALPLLLFPLINMCSKFLFIQLPCILPLSSIYTSDHRLIRTISAVMVLMGLDFGLRFPTYRHV